MEYHNEPVPEAGHLAQVAPGVFWLRMPLPFDLDHINLYLLEGSDGWYVIDTGLSTSPTREAWAQVEAQLNKPIVGVIVTHLHPDHIGLAGWLCSRWKVPLMMTTQEYYVGRSLFSVSDDADRWTDEQYFLSLGLSAEDARKAVAGSGGFKNVVSPIPLAFKRLVDGQVLEIGGRHWEVIVGSGHSPEHACLYCQEDHILLSGDQVLPGISPNIGVYSNEPEANPLRLFLASIEKLKVLPKQTLVLPAHNRPFNGLHERLVQLAQHHHRHLNALTVHCQTPQRAVDCLEVMFKRVLHGRNRFFALAECLSHLNYLWFDGQLERRLDEHGVYWYSATLPLQDESTEGQTQMDFLQV